MNTVVINIRTNQDVKIKAQKIASEMGLSLSALINSYLTQVIRTKTTVISATEEPTQYLLDSLKKSKADKEAGRVSPGFYSTKDAIAWLNNPNARLQNGDKV